MMEEQDQDKVDPDYLKGFNEGYILAQHSPELARNLANINSESSRFAGFKAGQEQHQAEQIRPFDQLYRQQEQNQKLSASIITQQKVEDSEDQFTQLKKKQEQGYKGPEIDHG